MTKPHVADVPEWRSLKEISTEVFHIFQTSVQVARDRYSFSSKFKSQRPTAGGIGHSN